MPFAYLFALAPAQPTQLRRTELSQRRGYTLALRGGGTFKLAVLGRLE